MEHGCKKSVDYDYTICKYIQHMTQVRSILRVQLSHLDFKRRRRKKRIPKHLVGESDTS